MSNYLTCGVLPSFCLKRGFWVILNEEQSTVNSNSLKIKPSTCLDKLKKQNKLLYAEIIGNQVTVLKIVQFQCNTKWIKKVAQKFWKMAVILWMTGLNVVTLIPPPLLIWTVLLFTIYSWLLGMLCIPVVSFPKHHKTFKSLIYFKAKKYVS